MKNRFFPRFFFFLLLFFLLSFPTAQPFASTTESVILEVEGDANEHAAYIKKNYPLIDVVAVYDTLFQGLALQGKARELNKLGSLDFIKQVHGVQTYTTLHRPSELSTDQNVVYPESLNDTSYTGSGVKVGVIDTGIDYLHADLEKNYEGGYDVVDLDDDPMETLPEEGMPTLHGTHVSGIIAADGELEGVAPDAELYGYRALGPGGMGTSVQVIAAMEQAVKDGMDILNLSLGNTVNGPDYPTSQAVNKAADLGVAVVIANGNSGPDNWTVGAPATASGALAVGAASEREQLPFLYDRKEDKKILLNPFPGSVPWNLESMYPLTAAPPSSNEVNGKIVLADVSQTPVHELAQMAEENGAVGIIVFKEVEEQAADHAEPSGIPIARVSMESGRWLMQRAEADYYIETVYEEIDTKAAPFSSRGPVTVNWQIKPDLLAPGTRIISTVPDGYQALQGTSMAAPHVAGVVALIKEAHPDWSTDKIYSALRTTAERVETEEGRVLPPIVQGAGNIQPKKAIETDTIIYDSLLAFGQLDENREKAKTEITIENKTSHEETYYFQTPKQSLGIRFQLPKQFTVAAGEKKTLPIHLDVTGLQLEEGVHQGWLTLRKQTEEEAYHLPYLFVHESAENPKTMGFEFYPQPFSEDLYKSRLYLTEPAKEVTVDLYDPDTLRHERTLVQAEDLDQGMNEFELSAKEVGAPGVYLALITTYLEDGDPESFETMVYVME